MSDVDFYLNQSLVVNTNAFIGGSLIQGHTTSQASGNNTVTSAGTVIDSVDITKIHSKTYLIQIVSDSGYEITEVLLIHNNQNSYLSEYGQLSTTGYPLMQFTTEIVNNYAQLIGTSTDASAKVWLQETVAETMAPPPITYNILSRDNSILVSRNGSEILTRA